MYLVISKCKTAFLVGLGILNMAKRIFVEKKADFQIKAEALLEELVHNLQLTSLSSLRLVQVYDIFNLEEELLEQAIKHIFMEQVTDKALLEEELGLESSVYFAIEALLVNLINVRLVAKRLSFYWVAVKMYVFILVSFLS